MQTILLIPTGSRVGLTSACLGIMRSYEYLGHQPHFFHPILQTDTFGTGIESTNHTATLISNYFKVPAGQGLKQTYVEQMIGDGQIDDLMEEVIALYEQVKQNVDVVIVEGLSPTSHTTYATQLNIALANALNAKVILVTTADMSNPQAVADTIDMHVRPVSDRMAGVLLMRLTHWEAVEETNNSTVFGSSGYKKLEHDIVTSLKPYTPLFSGQNPLPLIGLVPLDPKLMCTRVFEVSKALNATWLNEGEAKTRRIGSFTLCARTVSNILPVLKADSLIVVPGDRDDVLIAAALATMNGVHMAGVLLTGGYIPPQSVINLCMPAIKTGLPILSVDTDSFATATGLNAMSKEIPDDDMVRAGQVTDYVSDHINIDWVKQNSSTSTEYRLSPAAFRYSLVQKAQKANKKIVLPEGTEPRTIQAAIICQNRKIAQCILLAKPQDVQQVANNLGLQLPASLQIIDPDSIRQKYIQPMVERRKGKLNATSAEEQLQDTVVLGTMMLYMSDVDGLVSGAIHTTANTVRPAFQLIKTAPQFSLVSSIFFMLMPEQVVVYGDCAINPDPTADELAEIAIQSADSAISFGIEARVAMISYSTGESGTGTDVDKVRQATQIAQQRRPDLLIDGPLQYDAAAIESVGKQKAPNSPVAGRATVFVFPDLNTGNTTYKAVQRSANLVSVGPMLQGLNKPVNDLSRGALVEDIVYTIALTAVQANTSQP